MEQSTAQPGSSVTNKVNVVAVIIITMKYYSLSCSVSQLHASTRIIAVEMAAIHSSLYDSLIRMAFDVAVVFCPQLPHLRI